MEELINPCGLCSEMSGIDRLEKACDRYGIVLKAMNAHQRALLDQLNDQDMQFRALLPPKVVLKKGPPPCRHKGRHQK